MRPSTVPSEAGSLVVTAHVFVDETKERGYLVAAAIVCPESLAAARQSIRALILPRQRRIHFKAESDPRRRKVIDTLVDLKVRATLYDAYDHASSKQARDACLVRLVADIKEINAARLVLERDDSTLQSDEALLRRHIRVPGLMPDLRYEHLRAHEECLLAIPDAIAWCWARGGHWRTRMEEIVSQVRRV